MNNKQGYSIIYSAQSNANISCNIHVPTSQLKDWERIKKNHVGNYYITTLLRAVLRLAVGDRNVLTQTIIGDFRFSYTVSPNRKDIYIHLIEITNTKTPQAQTAGLYKAKWDKDQKWWEIKENTRPSPSMELSDQWYAGGGHMAAVAGKFKYKEDAAIEMGDHLEKAFYPVEDLLKDIRNGGHHYSLYWLNSEFTDAKHVQTLVSLIQQAQSQQAKVKWLIHGEGCGTFVQALNFIKKNPKSSDLFVAQKDINLQEVFFSNPRGAGTSKADLEKLCKDIGIKTVTININKHDVFFNPDARKSLRNKAMFTAGGVTLAGGASGFASGELGIDTIQKLIEFAQSNPSLTLSGGLFVAGGVAVIVQKAGDLNAFARNLKGVWGSSVGSGNQRWAG